jgi:hypothetical protein
MMVGSVGAIDGGWMTGGGETCAGSEGSGRKPDGGIKAGWTSVWSEVV